MKSNKELYEQLLSEMEILAKSFLGNFLSGKFESLQKLWDFEIDLVNHQKALRKAIDHERDIKKEAKEKSAEIVSQKQGKWQQKLQQLHIEIKKADDFIEIYRHVLKLSRQLGDAFAQVLLGEWMIPLTKGPSTPTHDGHNLSEDHGLTGMIGIAQSLSAAGAGFPILHDITNRLCTGDITFYSLDKKHITIEVKTHFKGKNKKMITLDVETHFIAASTSDDISKWRSINERIPKSFSFREGEENQTIKHTLYPPSPRLKRQIERMKTAKAWQSGPNHQIFDLANNDKGMKIDILLEKNAYHWEIVRDLIEEAKKDYVASRVVDDALVYQAFYHDSPPLTYPWAKGFNEPVNSILQSYNKIITDTLSILYSEKERNFLWVPSGEPPSDSLSFFLYPLPINIIIDIMWGKLAIVSVANLGKIAQSLEKIGLEVKLPKNDEEFKRSFLPISTKAVLPNGSIVAVELHQINSIVLKIAYDFLSLSGFVSMISQMMKNAEEQVLKEMR
jgi:hypothetical protein